MVKSNNKGFSLVEIIIAAAIFAILIYPITNALITATKTGTTSTKKQYAVEKAEEIMVPWDVPFLRMAAGLILNIFLLCVVVIMTAGVGATVEQLLAVPAQITSAVFVFLMGVVALLGISGMMKVFSALVPIIVIATMFFAVMSWVEFGTDGILTLPEQVHSNPLMPNWFVAALTYVAAALQAVLQLLRLILISGNSRRRD